MDEFEGALGAVKIIEECIDRYKEKYGSGESDKTQNNKNNKKNKKNRVRQNNKR